MRVPPQPINSHHATEEMDNNHTLSAVELVLRSELNCNASIESDSFFWFGLLSFSEVIDKMSQSATQLL